MLITKEAACLWEQREHGKSLPSAQFCHERDTAPKKKKSHIVFKKGSNGDE